MLAGDAGGGCTVCMYRTVRTEQQYIHAVHAEGRTAQPQQHGKYKQMQTNAITNRNWIQMRSDQMKSNQTNTEYIHHRGPLIAVPVSCLTCQNNISVVLVVVLTLVHAVNAAPLAVAASPRRAPLLRLRLRLRPAASPRRARSASLQQTASTPISDCDPALARPCPSPRTLSHCSLVHRRCIDIAVASLSWYPSLDIHPAPLHRSRARIPHAVSATATLTPCLAQRHLPSIHRIAITLADLLLAILLVAGLVLRETKPSAENGRYY